MGYGPDVNEKSPSNLYISMAQNVPDIYLISTCRFGAWSSACAMWRDDKGARAEGAKP